MLLLRLPIQVPYGLVSVSALGASRQVPGWCLLRRGTDSLADLLLVLLSSLHPEGQLREMNSEATGGSRRVSAMGGILILAGVGLDRE